MPRKKTKKQSNVSEKEEKQVEEVTAPKRFGAGTVSSDRPEHIELKELIEKNIKWSQVIYNQNKKIKHRMTMMVIGSYMRLLLIVIPIILGIVYLPPIIAQLLETMSSSLGLQGVPFTELGELIGNIQSGAADQGHLQELLQYSR